VNVPGEGLVGLITYMRTDSTNLSGEALGVVRAFIGEKYGAKYLPEKPRFYGSSNKSAQEAHEAIRPTNVRRTPDSLRGEIDEEQWKLYNLIWQRFVACQMTDAQYDSTAVLLERSDKSTGAVFKANGRVQTFDGYTITGIRGEGDDQEFLHRRPGAGGGLGTRAAGLCDGRAASVGDRLGGRGPALFHQHGLDLGLEGLGAVVVPHLSGVQKHQAGAGRRGRRADPLAGEIEDAGGVHDVTSGRRRGAVRSEDQ
jgi:hypothetical protein